MADLDDVYGDGGGALTFIETVDDCGDLPAATQDSQFDYRDLSPEVSKCSRKDIGAVGYCGII